VRAPIEHELADVCHYGGPDVDAAAAAAASAAVDAVAACAAASEECRRVQLYTKRHPRPY
jgi:hypothetical protein